MTKVKVQKPEDKNQTELYHHVKDEIFTQPQSHGDTVEIPDVGVRGEDVEPVDIGKRVHVVDGNRTVVLHEVPDKKYSLSYLHGLQPYHFMQGQRKEQLNHKKSG